jgi:predicted HTH domain antitoxin
MEVTLQLRDEIAEQLGDLDNMRRQLLEAIAVENYRLEKLTRHQASQLLGLDYWQTEELLAKHDAKRPYTLEDLEVDRKSLAGLPKK